MVAFVTCSSLQLIPLGSLPATTYQVKLVDLNFYATGGVRIPSCTEEIQWSEVDHNSAAGPARIIEVFRPHSMRRDRGFSTTWPYSASSKSSASEISPEKEVADGGITESSILGLFPPA